MSFFNAIANFKIALLEALTGNNLPYKGSEWEKPQKPGYGNSAHHHRPHSSQPSYNWSQPAKPVHGKPHAHSAPEYQVPIRLSYPICSLNR